MIFLNYAPATLLDDIIELKRERCGGDERKFRKHAK